MMIKTNKKGVSDVISTVLIILLVLAAVAIIATVIINSVSKGGTQITSSVSCQELQLTPVSCSYLSNLPTKPTVLISRGSGSSDISIARLSLVFEASDGSSEVKNVLTAPTALATDSYGPLPIGSLSKTPVKFTVAAVITGTDGKTQTCGQSPQKVTCNSIPALVCGDGIVSPGENCDTTPATKTCKGSGGDLIGNSQTCSVGTGCVWDTSNCFSAVQVS